jgi:hypothetical protein
MEVVEIGSPHSAFRQGNAKLQIPWYLRNTYYTPVIEIVPRGIDRELVSEVEVEFGGEIGFVEQDEGRAPLSLAITNQRR